MVGSQREKKVCFLINKGIHFPFEWHTLLFLKGRPLCASDPKALTRLRLLLLCWTTIDKVYKYNFSNKYYNTYTIMGYIKGWYYANRCDWFAIISCLKIDVWWNVCYSPLGRLVDWSIQHTSRWTRPLVTSLKHRKGQIFKLLVLANPTHSWWHNMVAH